MLHIIKLCVGISSVDELISYREPRGVRVAGVTGDCHIHRTRMRPKRGAEIIEAGSLYWVIKGAIRCRQRIVKLGFETDSEGKSCCDIIMDPEIIRTIPYPKRPFQGWRYLLEKDAPGDLNAGKELQNDAQLAAELAELGLI